MNPASKLDRALVDAIRNEVEWAAQEIARRHGLDALVTRCTCDAGGSNAAVTLQFATVVNGVAMTREAQEFEHGAGMVGLAAGVKLGATFAGRMPGGRETQFTVVGLAPRSGKTPVLAKCGGDGHTYKFAVDVVNRAVARVSGGAA